MVEIVSPGLLEVVVTVSFCSLVRRQISAHYLLPCPVQISKLITQRSMHAYSRLSSLCYSEILGTKKAKLDMKQFSSLVQEFSTLPTCVVLRQGLPM